MISRWTPRSPSRRKWNLRIYFAQSYYIHFRKYVSRKKKVETDFTLGPAGEVSENIVVSETLEYAPSSSSAADRRTMTREIEMKITIDGKDCLLPILPPTTY